MKLTNLRITIPYSSHTNSSEQSKIIISMRNPGDLKCSGTNKEEDDPKLSIPSYFTIDELSKPHTSPAVNIVVSVVPQTSETVLEYYYNYDVINEQILKSGMTIQNTESNQGVETIRAIEIAKSPRNAIRNENARREIKKWNPPEQSQILPKNNSEINIRNRRLYSKFDSIHKSLPTKITQLNLDVAPRYIQTMPSILEQLVTQEPAKKPADINQNSDSTKAKRSYRKRNAKATQIMKDDLNDQKRYAIDYSDISDDSNGAFIKGRDMPDITKDLEKKVPIVSTLSNVLKESGYQRGIGTKKMTAGFTISSTETSIKSQDISLVTNQLNTKVSNTTKLLKSVRIIPKYNGRNSGHVYIPNRDQLAHKESRPKIIVDVPKKQQPSLSNQNLKVSKIYRKNQNSSQLQPREYHPPVQQLQPFPNNLIFPPGTKQHKGESSIPNKNFPMGFRPGCYFPTTGPGPMPVPFAVPVLPLNASVLHPSMANIRAAAILESQLMKMRLMDQALAANHGNLGFPVYFPDPNKGMWPAGMEFQNSPPNSSNVFGSHSRPYIFKQ